MQAFLASHPLVLLCVQAVLVIATSRLLGVVLRVALVTTVMTSPLVAWLHRREGEELRAQAAAARAP